MSNLTEPLIRPARPADGPAVLDLARGLATSFPVDFDPFGSTFADVLDSPGATLLVAELRDQVLGYLLGFDHPSFFANGPVAWVEELAVQAAHRRHGLGSLLMKAFEVEVRGRGVRLVALATTRAGGFYLAIGYTEHAAYFRKLL